MAHSSYATKQIRIYVEDDLTHVYVLAEASGDCPLGVQGWHYKAFGPSTPILMVLPQEIIEYVEWPQAAPPRDVEAIQ